MNDGPGGVRVQVLSPAGTDVVGLRNSMLRTQVELLGLVRGSVENGTVMKAKISVSVTRTELKGPRPRV